MSLITSFKSTSTADKNVLVFDLETSVDPATHSPKYGDGGRPYMMALLSGFAADRIFVYDKLTDPMSLPAAPGDFKIVVGHNLKFDLEHAANVKLFNCGAIGSVEPLDFLTYIRKNCVVWDTQFLTYLKSGHNLKFPTLEESCAFWGVPMAKTLDVGAELEKNDWDIFKIPDLDKYVANDVDMTHELYLKQSQDSWVMDNISWILAMMQGLLGTFEIEHNGMHVNLEALNDLKTSAETTIMGLDVAMRDLLRVHFGVEFADEFNPASYTHVRGLLYGGNIVFKVREPAGVVMTGAKMGQPRFKLRTCEISVPASEYLYPDKSVDDDRLALIESYIREFPWKREFIGYLRKHRSYSKLHSTYLEGLAKHVRINVDGQAYVYPQINCCLTDTGRTSSSKPNMQNNPTHDELGVRAIYTSRYGSEGTLVEVDFKQIEIIALALLSKDPTLVTDILNGVDIHTETGKSVFGLRMSKEQRRTTKTINFGLIYGGGAEQLALQAGITKTLAQKLINAFYRRYPGVKLYFDQFYATAQALMDIGGNPTGDMVGTPPTMQKMFRWGSITGRQYTFKDFFNEKRKCMEVSYTQTRNYPIQGLATGDLMLAALGRVCRRLLYSKWTGVRLIGLIHDSLVFDLKTCDLQEFVLELKYLLEDSGKYLGRICGFDWDLPVKVEFSAGPNLNEMKPITV